MAFLIGQGDTIPNIPFALKQPDKTTPLDLSAATSVSIAIRKKGGPLLFIKACVITNAAAGEGYYDWVAGDTDAPGDYEYQFKVLWSDGNRVTIPVDEKFELTITDSID